MSIFANTVECLLRAFFCSNWKKINVLEKSGFSISLIYTLFFFIDFEFALEVQSSKK